MPQITDIKPQKKLRLGEPRFNIFLDGQFAFVLPAETLVKAGLKIDQQLCQEEIDKLVKENDYSKYLDLVLKFLSFRPRSEKEIKDWFRKKEVGSETQKIIITKLRNLGYLNDLEFVKWWIEQRQIFKPKGSRAIEMELRQKGITKETIVTLLNCSIVKLPEDEQAKKAIERKIPLWENLPPDKFRQKMTGFLARRGFSWETIDKIIDESQGKE